MTFIIILFIVIIFFIFSVRYHWWKSNICYFCPRILMYHQFEKKVDVQEKKWIVSMEKFEQQLSWLKKNNWVSYTMSELIKLNGKYPKKSFVLTFDDGYQNNYFIGFSLLKKYNFKATIYLVSRKRDNDWDKNKYKRKYLLNDQQIYEMDKSGLIEFGAHTCSHKNLLKLELPQVYDEIKKNKEDIEKKLNKKCRTFAYPFGKYGKEIFPILKKLNFTSAVTTNPSCICSQKNDLCLPRMTIDGRANMLDFYLTMNKGINK